MTRRCPWCGEKLEVSFGTFGEYKCKACDKKSIIKRDGWSYWLPAIVSFIVIISIQSLYSVSVLAIIYFAGLFDSSIAPLERIPQKFVPVKKSEAEVTFIKPFSFIKKRSTFTDEAIFTICFVDENDIPISHTIAVSIEYISFTEKGFDCKISFMPECKFNVDFKAGSRFYMFNEKEKIAQGTLKSDVCYPNFEVAKMP